MAAFSQKVRVSLAGRPYQLTYRWCEPNSSWVLDVADGQGNTLVAGIAVVPGVDLLQQYAYLGIQGQLVAQCDSDLNAVPNYDNLGTTGHIYFITTS